MRSSQSRWVALLVAPLALLGMAVAVAAPATAAPVAAPTAPPPGPQVGKAIHVTHVISADELAAAASPPEAVFPSTYVHGSITYLINNYTGLQIGPSSNTGYGEIQVTSIRKATCSGCTWYQVNETITNHQPTLAATPASKGRTTVNGVNASDAALGFCWPWHSDGVHCSVWNDIAGWDWPQMLHNLNFNPLNTTSTWDKLGACFEGAYSPATKAITGAAFGYWFGVSALIKLSAAGWVWSTVWNCNAYFYHHR